MRGRDFFLPPRSCREGTQSRNENFPALLIISSPGDRAGNRPTLITRRFPDFRCTVIMADLQGLSAATPHVIETWSITVTDWAKAQQSPVSVLLVSRKLTHAAQCGDVCRYDRREPNELFLPALASLMVC
jgi:hypothetical protein